MPSLFVVDLFTTFLKIIMIFGKQIGISSKSPYSIYIRKLWNKEN